MDNWKSFKKEGSIIMHNIAGLNDLKGLLQFN